MNNDEYLIENIDLKKTLNYIPYNENNNHNLEATQIDRQIFTYNNNEYHMLSFVKQGIMEFHFFTEMIISHEIIFSTVMKYIIDRVKSKNPQKIVIIGEQDRIRLYGLFINKVLKNYLTEYQITSEGIFQNKDMHDYIMYKWDISAKGNKIIESLKRNINGLSKN